MIVVCSEPVNTITGDEIRVYFSQDELEFIITIDDVKAGYPKYTGRFSINEILNGKLFITLSPSLDSYLIEFATRMNKLKAFC